MSEVKTRKLSKNGKPLGRPRKGEIRAKQKGGRGKVGRPAGEKAILDEYRARMLARPDSEDVVNAIYKAALDDKHKNQSVAWKIITDRVLPIKMFEGGSDTKPQVSINISSASGSVSVNGSEHSEESEYIEGELDAD